MQRGLRELVLLVRRIIARDADAVRWTHIIALLEALADLESRRQVYLSLARAAIETPQVFGSLSHDQRNALQALAKPKKAKKARLQFWIITMAWRTEHLLRVHLSTSKSSSIAELKDRYLMASHQHSGGPIGCTGKDVCSESPHVLAQEELASLHEQYGRYSALERATEQWRMAGRPAASKPTRLKEEEAMSSISTVFDVTEAYLRALEDVARTWQKVEEACVAQRKVSPAKRSEPATTGTKPPSFSSTANRVAHATPAPVATSSKVRLEDMQVNLPAKRRATVSRGTGTEDLPFINPAGTVTAFSNSSIQADSLHTTSESPGRDLDIPNSAAVLVQIIPATSNPSNSQTAAQGSSQETSLAVTTAGSQSNGTTNILVTPDEVVIKPSGLKNAEVLAPDSQPSSQIANAITIPLKPKPGLTKPDKQKRNGDIAYDAPSGEMLALLAAGARRFDMPRFVVPDVSNRPVYDDAREILDPVVADEDDTLQAHPRKRHKSKPKTLAYVQYDIGFRTLMREHAALLSQSGPSAQLDWQIQEAIRRCVPPSPDSDGGLAYQDSLDRGDVVSVHSHGDYPSPITPLTFEDRSDPPLSEYDTHVTGLEEIGDANLPVSLAAVNQQLRQESYAYDNIAQELVPAAPPFKLTESSVLHSTVESLQSRDPLSLPQGGQARRTDALVSLSVEALPPSRQPGPFQGPSFPTSSEKSLAPSSAPILILPPDSDAPDGDGIPLLASPVEWRDSYGPQAAYTLSEAGRDPSVVSSQNQESREGADAYDHVLTFVTQDTSLA